MSHTRMTTLAAFSLLELSPLLVFEFDFLSLLEYPSEYFDDTWYKCRTGRDVVYKNDNSGGIGGTFVFCFFFSKKPFLVYFKLLLIQKAN